MKGKFYGICHLRAVFESSFSSILIRIIVAIDTTTVLEHEVISQSSYFVASSLINSQDNVPTFPEAGLLLAYLLKYKNLASRIGIRQAPEDVVCSDYRYWLKDVDKGWLGTDSLMRFRSRAQRSPHR